MSCYVHTCLDSYRLRPLHLTPLHPVVTTLRPTLTCPQCHCQTSPRPNDLTNRSRIRKSTENPVPDLRNSRQIILTKRPIKRRQTILGRRDITRIRLSNRAEIASNLWERRFDRSESFEPAKIVPGIRVSSPAKRTGSSHAQPLGAAQGLPPPPREKSPSWG